MTHKPFFSRDAATSRALAAPDAVENTQWRAGKPERLIRADVVAGKIGEDGGRQRNPQIGNRRRGTLLRGHAYAHLTARTVLGHIRRRRRLVGGGAPLRLAIRATGGLPGIRIRCRQRPGATPPQWQCHCHGIHQRQEFEPASHTLILRSQPEKGSPLNPQILPWFHVSGVKIGIKGSCLLPLLTPISSRLSKCFLKNAQHRFRRDGARVDAENPLDAQRLLGELGQLLSLHAKVAQTIGNADRRLQPLDGRD